jgi:hypothetical protein
METPLVSSERNELRLLNVWKNTREDFPFITDNFLNEAQTGPPLFFMEDRFALNYGLLNLKTDGYSFRLSEKMGHQSGSRKG